MEKLNIQQEKIDDIELLTAPTTKNDKFQTKETTPSIWTILAAQTIEINENQIFITPSENNEKKSN